MQWVGRAISSVSQYYKEINPATLSGAIDVIVVEHEDPKTGTTTLSCSPFHVRFGKLSVLRPVDRTVYLKINDTDSPFHMKVGDTGEAFFVFETDQDVPADMQTSPITGPIQDEELGEDPGPLDLGDSITSVAGPSSRPYEEHATDSTKVNAEEKAELEQKHISRTSKALEGAVSRLQDTGKGFIDTVAGSERLGRASDKVLSRLPSHRKDKGGDPYATEESFVASEFASAVRLHDDEASSPRPFGSTPGRHLAYKNLEESSTEAAQVAGHEKEDTKSSYFSSDSFAPSLPTAELGVQHELMLDMAGYKTQQQDSNSADGIKTPPEFALRYAEDGSVVTDTESQDLHERDADVFALTRALLRYSESKELQQKGSATQPLDTSAPDTAPSTSEVTKAAADPFMFVLFSEGTTYIFEIAVCKEVSESTSPRQPTTAQFDASRITNEQFLKQPELLQDPHQWLYVRFRGRYFGWDNGSHILTMLTLYRKALLQGQPKPQTPTPKGTWSRWWGRNQARNRTTTDESISTIPTDQSEKSSLAPPSNLDGKTSLSHEQLSRSRTEPLLVATPPPLTSSPSAPELPSSPNPSQAEKAVAQESLTSSLSEQKHYAKTLRLTSDQLKTLNLQKGANDVSFTVQSSFSGVAMITARIFLWQSDYQIVISDIDGTITKSDALGHVFTMIGRDWTHPGVAKLYTDIARNGYRMLYLTSRAVGQADVTREYLRGVQQSGFTLPDGPVIMSPDRLFTSLHREVVLRKPEVFKMGCLRDIKRLFVDRNPFYAGFGNRLTDGLSYRHVEIPSSRIFTIDSYGNVKLELLELAGYSSTYIAMANLVDETFPPVNRSNQPAFNDFNYWRQALPDVELPDLVPEPASPALSARSDSSRMSVFRVTALAGALSKRSSRNQLKPSSNLANETDGQKSPLSASPRSSSPSPLQTIQDSGKDDEDDGLIRRHRRSDSMPGSFEDESHLDAMRDSIELERGDNSGIGWREGERNAEDDGQEDDEDETLDNTLEDDDLPDIDFGSVPYL